VDSTSAEFKAEVAAWKPDPPKKSIHADSLVQLDNGVKIPSDPSKWKCCKCDLTENLWLNLSDGSLLCGRKNWDGSGGNGHALEHFNETKYPLCVKLGTITSEGADVFSYAEDDMVTDPHLAKHLR
jgi:ubiquitin carboxyl-terminal hydrolase 5/13